MTPPRLALLAILAAYALLAVGYNLATPMGEAPDEPSHVQYVMYLRENRRLPVVPAGGGGQMPQGKHPPLYYLAGLALSGGDNFRSLGFIINPHFRFDPAHPDVVAAFAHPPDQRYPYTSGERAARRMRLVSLLAGLVTIMATWRVGRLAWPGAPEIAAAAAAIVAFTPGFLALGGAFNNDAFAVAATSTALAASAQVALGRAGPRGGAALGVALGVGLLSKLTTLMAWPVAVAAAAIDIARRRQPRAMLRAGAPAAAAALLLTAPWLARNARLYGWRDPLGLARWTDSIPHLARTVPLSTELGAYLRLQFETFWGRFGWSSIDMPAPVYAGIGAVLCASAAGLGVLALRGWRRRNGADETGIVLGLCALAACLAYAQTLRLGLQLNLVAAHGRYLYVALPAIGVLVASGLLGPLPRRPRRAASALVAAAWLALGAGALGGVLAPAFRAPAAVGAQELAGLAPVGVAFGDALRLVGWRVEAAGAGSRSTDDPAIARIDVGHDASARPGGSSTAGGESSAGASPARISSSSASSDGASSDRAAPHAALHVALFWSAARALWLDANDVPDGPRSPSHVAFAHLVGATGEVIGRTDAAPFGGTFPTGAWPPGAVFRQDLVVHVDASAPAGRATLLVGAYPLGQPELRLPVRSDGAAAPRDERDAPDAGPRDALAIGPIVVTAGADRLVNEDGEAEGAVSAAGAGSAIGQDAAVGPLTARGDAFGEELGDAAIVLDALGWRPGARGEPDALVTRWRPARWLDRDLTLFVHVVDADGQLLATVDGPPTGGRYPTSLWAPGEPVVDERALPLPLPPGTAGLRIGWYDAQTGARLSASGADGALWPDDAVVVERTR